MADNTTISHLGELVCVCLDIHLWDATRRLSDSDLQNVSKDQLPPEEVSSMGSKHIFDKKRINPINSMRREAERECEKDGIRFLKGMYAIPKDKAKGALQRLDAIALKFQEKVEELSQNYDDWFSDFLEAKKADGNPVHPDWWKDQLRKAKLPRDVVIAKYHYGYQTFSVTPVDSEDPRIPEHANNGLVSQVSGLSGQLFDEIAAKARDVLGDPSRPTAYLAREKVNQSFRAHFGYIREKMDGLSFLDPRIQPLIDRIDAVLPTIPKTGYVDGVHFNAIIGLLSLLSDSQRMKDHGQAVLNSRNTVGQKGEGQDFDELVDSDDSADHTANVVQLPSSSIQPNEEEHPATEESMPTQQDDLSSGGMFF